VFQSLLDVRTVLVGYVLANALCLVVIAALYRQNRTRSPEMALWVWDYALQFAGLLLIALRGVIPSFMSVVVANVCVIVGTVLLYQGLERYVAKKGWQIQNYVLIAVFSAVETYFLLVNDQLAARTMNISVGVGLLSIETAWLMLRRARPELRPETRATGLVLVAFAVLNGARVVGVLRGIGGTEFLRSGVDAAAILGYQVLYVGLTFSLLLLVSRRLHMDLERDIVQRRAAEAALKRSEEKFAVAFHTVPDAIIITLLDNGRIVEANQSTFEVLGFTKEEMIGRTTVELEVWAEPAERRRFVEALESSGGIVGFATSLRRKSGEVFPATISGETIEVSGVPCALTVVHDSTERVLAEERLRELSERDPLTSILNHRTFHEVAARRLSTADRRAALLFMDLDGLKSINDRHGHAAGDKALVAFGEVLREAFRESDIIGRLGGDEFAVLALPRGDASDETLTARFREALERRNASKTLPFDLEASVGIAWWDPSGGAPDLGRLVNEADARMYDAKRARGAAPRPQGSP